MNDDPYPRLVYRWSPDRPNPTAPWITDPLEQFQAIADELPDPPDWTTEDVR